MTLPELALRFILANPDVSTVIPGMRAAGTSRQNLGVSDGRTFARRAAPAARRHRWVRTYDCLSRCVSGRRPGMAR